MITNVDILTPMMDLTDFSKESIQNPAHHLSTMVTIMSNLPMTSMEILLA